MDGRIQTMSKKYVIKDGKAYEIATAKGKNKKKKSKKHKKKMVKKTKFQKAVGGVTGKTKQVFGGVGKEVGGLVSGKKKWR